MIMPKQLTLKRRCTFTNLHCGTRERQTSSGKLDLVVIFVRFPSSPPKVELKSCADKASSGKGFGRGHGLF